MNAWRAASVVGYVRPAGLVLLVSLPFLGGCTADLPSELPAQESTGDCVLVHGEWICPWPATGTEPPG